MNHVSLPIVFLLLTKSCLASLEFSYDGKDGPSNWGSLTNTCVGKHQSPINIDEHNVTDVTLPELMFSGLNLHRKFSIVNNGHTVMLKVKQGERFLVAGGPLNGEYVFEQMHFHWGDNDNSGSEDLINNHSYAMELHVVFFKRNYGSMDEAVKHPDGLTVLAYFYEVGREENPIYHDIVNTLPVLALVGETKTLRHPIPMNELLIPKSNSHQDYFTYNGSLTTPPCLEIVTWIDFKVPQRVSHNQLEAFRNIQSTDGHHLTHNFRPVQPLEDRTVYHNVPVSDRRNRNAESGSSLMLGSLMCTILAALCAFIL